MSAPGTTWMIPGDTVDPYAGKVGKSLVLPYGIFGQMTHRTLDDVLMSVQKHLAEVLDEVGAEWLTGVDMNGDPVVSQSWEVRLWSEQTAYRTPFARVAAVGPDAVTGRGPRYSDHAQSMTVHLYPHPSQDSERAVLSAERLKTRISEAFEFGAARMKGLGMAVPLWDFQRGNGDLYADSETRQPGDYVRVGSLTAERLSDPEDGRAAWVVLNFRAQWRRVPRVSPGLLVQSVRVQAHPE